ncbi:WD40 repeat-like protein [Sistotremastrum suecicum HHB10207 ss-3]|uniref:WD40 repeat-like protein n=1 Tax=Sistotremastrum suecicum HHB10207 ss-3 TaxID=1314776 RepID=A0A166IXR5_9AGAM|nr:WD40 repeat-like protein [Sistotremastrum suecicum HHB10207 ss-3]
MNHAQAGQQQQQSMQQSLSNQGQQQQQPQGQNQIPPPPPPPNGQDLNLSAVLHFLQTEWRRYERDRNEWEIERAEMRARIALLEGERRSFENVKLDIMRRIKMLEYALRMERSKQLNQTSGAASTKGSQPTSQGDRPLQKDDAQSHKGGSIGSSSPRSDDSPLPDQRLSISSLPNVPNGVPFSGLSSKTGAAPNNWALQANGLGPVPSAANLGKAPPGRDPKSRARSRDYLKQCLQEVTYLTSPQALNPLPNRPLLNNSSIPLSLPNVPSLDASAYNGRPRKFVPEPDKDASSLNGGISLLPSSNAPTSQPPLPTTLLDRERDLRDKANVSFPAQGQPGPERSAQQETTTQNQQNPTPLAPPQHPALRDRDPEIDEPRRLNSVFRSDDHSEWKDRLNYGTERFPTMDNLPSSGGLDDTMDLYPRDEDEELKDEDHVLDDESSSEAESDSGKVWKVRRTMKSHLDAVRAMSFHPQELCLATGGDDYTVKIWRMEPSDLTSLSNKQAAEIEPQLTLRGHVAPITCLVHAPSKNLLYSASIDSTIRIWALPEKSLPAYSAYDASRSLGELVGHTDAVWDLALIRDESLLISCGAEGAVKVWDLSSPPFESLRTSWGYYGRKEDGDGDYPADKQVGATCLEPIKTDLRKIAVAYQDATVKIFDVDLGKELSVFHTDVEADQAPMGPVNKLASHPTMPLIVTAHEDKHIRIFDIFTGQCTHSMLAHLDAVTCLSIDAAGFTLVSGAHDCSIRFWDILNTRACIQESTTHRQKANEGVLDVEFHPTLPFLASAGADGTVRLYASS